MGSKPKNEAEAGEEASPPGARLQVDLTQLEGAHAAPGAQLVLRAEHGGRLLGETPHMSAPVDGLLADLELRAEVPYDVDDPASLDLLAAHPLLFSLLEVAGRDRVHTTGVCNMDLVPVLLGEDERLRTTLLVQQARGVLAPHEAASWPNLPRLSVAARRLGPSPPAPNMLHVTLEAVLGLDTAPETAAVLLPTGKEAHFGLGSRERSGERYKRWASLHHVTGRGALSTYQLADDMTVPSAETPCEALLAGPRVEWDALWRCWLDDTDAQTLLGVLSRYGRLPLELVLATPSRTRQESPQLSAGHYVAYPDLRTLTYPGVKRARLSAPVKSYNRREMADLAGVHRPLVDTSPTESSKVSRSAAKTRRTESRRSLPASTAAEEDRQDEAGEGEALLDAEGRAVLAVIEVELLRPLVAARSPYQLKASLRQLVPDLPREAPSVAHTRQAELRYHLAVRTSCELLSRHYRELVAGRGQSPSAMDGPQLARELGAHLVATGGRQAVMEALRGPVAALVARRWPRDFPSQLDVEEVHAELVGVMHKVVSSLAEPGAVALGAPPAVTSRRLLVFALEADEEDDEARAEHFHLRRISQHGDTEPQVWLDYAVFLWRRRRSDKALQSCLEARGRDAHDMPAALLHALLLDEQGDRQEAATLLEALLGLLPAASAAPWVLLHLLHLEAGRQAGADVALHAAQRLVAAPLHAGPEPLSWDGRAHHRNTEQQRRGARVAFLEAAVTFMRLGAHGRAAQALGRAGPASLVELYYLAVCSYLAGDPACGLVHLARAVRMHGDHCLLRSLQGHCQHSLGHLGAAEECYEYVLRSVDRPPQYHLEALRLAGYWLHQGRIADANNLYLQVCSQTPTPKAWLGAGVSSASLGLLEDSERALAMACALDNTCPVVWEHLAQVNLRLGRHRQYQQCMHQALRRGLVVTDEKDQFAKSFNKVIPDSELPNMCNQHAPDS